MRSRRVVLRALATLPVAAVVPEALPRDYASREEVSAAIETLCAAVDVRLGAIVRVAPPSARFVASVRADLLRHRRERGTAASAPPEVEDGASLPRLRGALEELMHAHAEGLPALEDGDAVRRLAEHMVDLARIVTVIDLWMEMEGLE